jgi:hypothetical protein
MSETKTSGEWRKSSLSAGGECVEVSMDTDYIAVRHSRDAAGAILTFTPGEWSAFVGGVRLGEFDVTLPSD